MRLVLTLVGADRAGLVAAVAEAVSEHGGNWESSELAELGGAFAGVVQVSVPDDRVDAVTSALGRLDGLLTIAAHRGVEPARPAPALPFTLTVLGNDHPGIVRDVSAALRAHAVSIDHMTTGVRDAAMYGGRLFEASITAHAPAGADLAALRSDLERIAAEIQADIVVGE